MLAQDAPDLPVLPDSYPAYDLLSENKPKLRVGYGMLPIIC